MSKKSRPMPPMPPAAVTPAATEPAKPSVADALAELQRRCNNVAIALSNNRVQYIETEGALYKQLVELSSQMNTLNATSAPASQETK